jgi:F-type H+-transporting ATPase subunit beta
MSKSGVIAQVIGPVVDVSFAGGDNKLPKIYEALYIDRPDGTRIILECQKHLGESMIRTVAMDSTDGLVRGMTVTSTESPIVMPTGDDIRGRLFNVVGEAIDGMKKVNSEGPRAIHRDAPAFEELSTTSEPLYTGIKVIDLIEPYAKGGKIGLFGGAVWVKLY